jgi:hypothetical protein
MLLFAWLLLTVLLQHVAGPPSRSRLLGTPEIESTVVKNDRLIRFYIALWCHHSLAAHGWTSFQLQATL